MKFVKFCYFLLHFLRLARHELETRQVARSMFLRLVVAKLGYRKDYSGLVHSLKNVKTLTPHVLFISSTHTNGFCLPLSKEN
jgi:hypothetical protein